MPDSTPNTERRDLEDVVNCILVITPNQGRISVSALMTAIGSRSFGR